MDIRNKNVETGLIFRSDRAVNMQTKNLLIQLNLVKPLKVGVEKIFYWIIQKLRSFFNHKNRINSCQQTHNKNNKIEMEFFEYIEIWYNKKRHHGALNYKKIEEFNNQNNIYKNVA